MNFVKMIFKKILLNKKINLLIHRLLVSGHNKLYSIISTFAFIRNNEFSDSLKIAKILLDDKHDLIHKAVGWTLREVGKKDVSLLEKFIRTNYSRMSGTALRYAIEKFAEEKRKRYLLGNF